MMKTIRRVDGKKYWKRNENRSICVDRGLILARKAKLRCKCIYNETIHPPDITSTFLWSTRYSPIRRMGSRSDDDITPHLNLPEYWHKTFEEIFQAFSPDEWKLEPTKNGMPQEWRSFKDGAKVKFLCSCGNSWTSMRGIVIFWFKKIGAREAEREERGSELGLEATTTVNRTGNVCMY